MARAPAGLRGSPRLRTSAHRKRTTPCSTAHRAAARGGESGARCIASNRRRASPQGPWQPALFTRARRNLALADMTVTWAELTSGVEEVASDWRSARPERQARRNLDPADFARLAGRWLPPRRGARGAGRPLAERRRIDPPRSPRYFARLPVPTRRLRWSPRCTRPSSASGWHVPTRHVRSGRSSAMRCSLPPPTAASGGRSPRSRAAAATSCARERRRARTMGRPDRCQAPPTASAATSTSAAALA